MSTFTGQTKSSVSTMNVLSKSTITQSRTAKAGSAWQYDQAGFSYDGPIDTVTGLPINYNGEGTLPNWSVLAKS